MGGVSLSLAFIAGVVSFLSPCIFPLVPGYLAYLAGASMTGAAPSRRETFLHSLFFVVGFSVVFTVLGIILQTALSSVAYDARVWLSRAGGVLIIAFGIYLTGLVRIPFFERAHTISVTGGPARSRFVTSLVFGAAFAFGWTPCIGAVLGAILTLAVTQASSAFVLLLVYSIGLGIPFLIVGVFAAAAQPYINRFAGTARSVTALFGVLLVIVGMLVFTQRLDRIANFESVNKILIRY